MTLYVPAKHLRQYLTSRDGPWLKNLPRDFHFAGIGLDRARVGFVVMIGSEEFAAVRAREPIPEFQGSYWTVEEYTDSLLQKFRSERPGEWWIVLNALFVRDRDVDCLAPERRDKAPIPESGKILLGVG